MVLCLISDNNSTVFSSHFSYLKCLVGDSLTSVLLVCVLEKL